MPDPALSPALPRPWWRWPNLLGLDAVAVALVWMLLFARGLGVRLVPAEFVVLGCAVWLVYVLDRIFDSRMPPENVALQDRHEVAGRHWLRFLPLLLIALGTGTWLALTAIPQIVLTSGARVGLCVLAYFGVVWLSRQKQQSAAGVLIVSGVIVVALLQGTAPGSLLPQLWRAIFSGFILTTLFYSVRMHPGQPPWTLPRKLLGGLLFAAGTAVTAIAHGELWDELRSGAAIPLFGLLCGLNSLGIRLWEQHDNTDVETGMLRRLYPWMAAMVAGGAVGEALAAPALHRPILWAIAGAATGLLLLHGARHRCSARALGTLADAAILLAGVVTLLCLR